MFTVVNSTSFLYDFVEAVDHQRVKGYQKKGWDHLYKHLRKNDKHNPRESFQDVVLPNNLALVPTLWECGGGFLQFAFTDISKLDRTGIWLNLNTFTLNNFGEEPWNLPSKADQNSQTTVKAWVVLSRE